jgi:pimeloyl-ACP methyl ester carboxylesterase
MLTTTFGSRDCLYTKNQASGRDAYKYVCPLTDFEIREKHHSLLESHIIAISYDGYGLDPITLKPVRDSAEYNRRLEVVLDSAIHGVKSGSYDRIMIFIHGGLNSYSSSVERAISLTDSMSKDKVYPIFIIWNSEGLSSYWEHIWKVRQGRVNQYAFFRGLELPFVVASDVLTGLARSPVVISSNVWTDVKTMFKTFDANSDTVYLKMRNPGPGRAAMDLHKGEDSIGGWNKFGKFLNYSLTIPFRWGSDPIIDAFGTPDWNIMLRRTNTLFRTNDEFDIRKIREDGGKMEIHMRSEASGALSWAMRMLAAKVAGDTTIRMDLIGHSMGAIVANKVLANFPELRFRNIVYMAAACRVRDFNEYVVPYLKYHGGKDPSAPRSPIHFYNLTLHPLAERREANFSLCGFDFFQRGSLLEWIDNFFSGPNNTEERTLGKYENIYQSLHMIPEDIRPQVTIKTFGVGRIHPRAPQKHGSFSNFPFWRTEFWNTKPADTALIREIPDPNRNRLIFPPNI